MIEKHWHMQYESSTPPKSMIFNAEERQKAAVGLFSIPNWLARFWMSVLSEYLVVQLALLLIEVLHLLHWASYFPGKVSHSFLLNLSTTQAQISWGFSLFAFFLCFFFPSLLSPPLPFHLPLSSTFYFSSPPSFPPPSLTLSPLSLVSLPFNF